MKRDPNRCLRAYWSNREDDLMLYHPTHKADGHWLSGVFNKAFTDELDRRGFDVKSLLFSVKLKEAKERAK